MEKTAHELSVDGDEPPVRYIVKQSPFGLIDSFISSVSIPTINLSLLFSLDEKELNKFRSAMISWGCFQIMSNGIIKSPIHRAVTNEERLRISVAVSNEPQPEREIGPADGLVDDKRPKLYKTVKNYAAINFECFQKGQMGLDTVKTKSK